MPRHGTSVAFLTKLTRSFAFSTGEMRTLVRDFHLEMERGLAGKKGTLKMIPAYCDRPTGAEKGRFIALDLGGTNFRVLELELKGGGRSSVKLVRTFTLTKKCVTGSGEALFDFIAGAIMDFLDELKERREQRTLGFTFSFPIEQSGIDSGVLLYWTKGFSAKGVIGKDIVGLLREALHKRGLNNIEVTAIANDTVGTLVSKCYEDADCDVGVILGTGTNACYSEDIERILKLKDRASRTGRMIVNTEWGNFNKLRMTAYDTALDRASRNRGEQILEKRVSGMYLGELVRLVCRDYIGKKILFGGTTPRLFVSTGAFKSEYMSSIERDTSGDLRCVAAFLSGLGVRNTSFFERKVIRTISSLVSLRAARISAAALAAVITKTDPALAHRHTIAIDGSVYEKHPHFASNMRAALTELFKKKSSHIRLSLAKDGSGKGIAIIAAISS